MWACKISRLSHQWLKIYGILLFAAFTKKDKTALLKFKSINISHHKCFKNNIFINYEIISKVTKMLFSKVNYVKKLPECRIYKYRKIKIPLYESYKYI